MPTVRQLIERGAYDNNRALFESDALAEVGLSEYEPGVQRAATRLARTRVPDATQDTILVELERLAGLVRVSVRETVSASRCSWSTSMNALSLLLSQYESAVREGRIEHLPGVTDGTVTTLNELWDAMSDLSCYREDIEEAIATMRREGAGGP